MGKDWFFCQIQSKLWDRPKSLIIFCLCPIWIMGIQMLSPSCWVLGLSNWTELSKFSIYPATQPNHPPTHSTSHPPNHQNSSEIAGIWFKLLSNIDRTGQRDLNLNNFKWVYLWLLGNCFPKFYLNWPRQIFLFL